MNNESQLTPVQSAKEAGPAELSVYLSQITAASTSSFIGKVAYRAYELGVSQAVITDLLKDHFSQLGYDNLRPLRITHYVKGCYRWAKDREEAPI